MREKSEDMPPAIRLTTLGSFGLEFGGRPVDIGRTKNRAVFAYLCMNAGRIFTREYLADFFWAKVKRKRADIH